jgi:hypothetical protein
MSVAGPPLDAPRWKSRGRIIALALTALGVLAIVLLALVVPPPGKANAVDVELARDVASFESALAAGWRSDGSRACGFGAEPSATGASIGRLRCHLLADSLTLVPAYVGLVLLLTPALCRRLAWHHPVAVAALCLPVVATGFFDIAENGMTVTAAQDLLDGVLAAGTVSDVRAASLAKWWLAAFSFGLLGALALRAWRAERDRRLLAGGALAAAGALAMAWGLGLASTPQPQWGMGLAIVALLLLVWWRVRAFSDDAAPG